MLSSDFPFRVATDHGVEFLLCDPSDTLSRATLASGTARPTVGDFVACDAFGRIRAIAPRRSWLKRARSGGAQLIAANVSTAFIVTSPEVREFSPRRVARYLIAVRAGHIDPVVVLNKTDSIDDLDRYLGELRSVSEGAPVIPISASTGENCDALEMYLGASATVVLCGSSGVGKSTLLNRLLGANIMTTATMRADGRGRHTTTFRRLLRLPSGGALIDTPGMRAFAPDADLDDIDTQFSDVTMAAQRCRFADCAHATEPGCAVRETIADERREQYHKLQREIEWLASREDVLLAAERKRRWKAIQKGLRD